MIYLYRDQATGEIVEREFPMSEGGPWELREGDRVLERADFGAVQRPTKERRKIARDPKGTRIGNKSLPRNWPFAEKFDSAGRPVFDSKTEQNEANARAAAAGEVLLPRDLSQSGNPQGMRLDE